MNKRISPAPEKTVITTQTAAPISTPKIFEFIANSIVDPDVVRFTIEVDRGVEVTRFNAYDADNRCIIKKAILGTAWRELVQYDPLTARPRTRNRLIRKLLTRGLLQSEVAGVLGVSQSLVSKVWSTK